MKILVVDDSRTMREFLCDCLAKLGFTEIEQAADGLDGLSKATALEPGLIVLDWNMPRMNGVTMTRRLCANGSDVPIIMVTVESDRQRVLEAVNAGVSQYIVKPFTHEVLAEKIVQMKLTDEAA